MALVRNFERKELHRPTLHKEIGASYSIAEVDGRVLIQIDTFGTDDRKFPGKKSQTLQFDRQGAEALFEILKLEFGLR